MDALHDIQDFPRQAINPPGTPATPPQRLLTTRCYKSCGALQLTVSAQEAALAAGSRRRGPLHARRPRRASRGAARRAPHAFGAYIRLRRRRPARRIFCATSARPRWAGGPAAEAWPGVRAAPDGGAAGGWRAGRGASAWRGAAMAELRRRGGPAPAQARAFGGCNTQMLNVTA